MFQLYNTRLSRGGKVTDCSSYGCKNRTICMLRSMRAENNCVSHHTTVRNLGLTSNPLSRSRSDLGFRSKTRSATRTCDPLSSLLLASEH